MEVVVNLAISADQYLAYYQGAVKEVVAPSIDGRTIRFPCTILQPFVTHNGIHGRFAISFDRNNKFKEIRRLS